MDPGGRRVPRGIHALTALHGAGALACFVMSAGSALSEPFRLGLARSGGSALMVAWFGPWVWAFLLGVGALLALLSYGSWRLRPWALPLTVACYAVGVLGSLWEVSIGIREGWLGAAINAAVVVYALTPPVRRAYLGR